MAIFVLVEFPDDVEAHDFVNIHLQAKKNDPEEYPLTVWGVYKKPTQFCACVGGKKTATGFTRGLNYGWWVCARCKKPTKLWASGAYWFSVVGTNLLPKALRPYNDGMHHSLESPMQWNDLLPTPLENETGEG